MISKTVIVLFEEFFVVYRETRYQVRLTQTNYQFIYLKKCINGNMKSYISKSQLSIEVYVILKQPSEKTYFYLLHLIFTSPSVPVQLEPETLQHILRKFRYRFDTTSRLLKRIKRNKSCMQSGNWTDRGFSGRRRNIYV